MNRFILAIIILFFNISVFSENVKVLNPLKNKNKIHLDHSAYFKEDFKAPQDVTMKCLSCHQESADEVMKTAHWLWQSGDVERNGKTVLTGKKNLMNNYCISVSGNWASCTKCHAGYGWTEKNYDFSQKKMWIA